MSADRSDLLRPSDRGAAMVMSSSRAGPAESTSTRDLTTQQLVDRTETEIKNQDAAIEKMSEGLTSLTSIGKAIGDETTLHMVR